MFWADSIVDSIEKNLKNRISEGKTLIIRDEKTASGHMHVGSMRGVVVHGVISEVLTERGIANKFLYEINDTDSMDKIPVYLDQEKYKEHLGKPLFRIPSPDAKATNYAEYFGKEFIGVINENGFYPELYRSSELYLSGRMNDVIRLSLENADKIREIYKRVSGSVKDSDWMPLLVVCERCGKVGTTKVTAFDGEKVTYVCQGYNYAEGCGHDGKVSPFDGNAFLPWKPEWAAKFVVVDVDIEGGGKDHYTKGGSRDVANAISREVFDHKPPFDVPYEFFLVDGKKMSSSKGNAATSRAVADLLPQKIFRLAQIGKKLNQAFTFEPEGDTVPILYDNYDRIAKQYFEGVNDDNSRLFKFLHEPGTELVQGFLPRFSQVAFMVQMPHINLVEAFEKIKESPLTKAEVEELDMRARYAKRWLDDYAPENYKFELQIERTPEVNFSAEQKEALKKILKYVEANPVLDGLETHTTIHTIRKELEIEPKDLFSALYISFLNKESGPKVGWFLSVH